MDNVRLCRVHWLGIISSLFEKGKKPTIVFLSFDGKHEPKQ